MDVIEAIRRRQSTGAMKTDPIPREIVEKLLEAAVQAPNHYKVRPWRFVVLAGAGRLKLGDVMANVFRRRFPEIDPAAIEKERSKPLRSPVIIAVAVEKPTEPKVLEVENICAAAAACENLLLAAGAFGLGGHWRTGDAVRDPEIKRFLGFEVDQTVIAFLYLGYPEVWTEPPSRPGFEERTRWVT
jgi:nitroreductase